MTANCFKDFSLSLQSAFHLSIAVLVRYRSHGSNQPWWEHTHLFIRAAVPRSSTFSCPQSVPQISSSLEGILSLSHPVIPHTVGELGWGQKCVDTSDQQRPLQSHQPDNSGNSWSGHSNKKCCVSSFAITETFTVVFFSFPH